MPSCSRYSFKYKKSSINWCDEEIALKLNTDISKYKRKESEVRERASLTKACSNEIGNAGFYSPIIEKEQTYSWHSFIRSTKFTRFLFATCLCMVFYNVVFSQIDTPSYKIPISFDKIFWKGDTAFYEVNDINLSHLITPLFDEQNSSHPKTTFRSGSTKRAYYPAQCVLDLGEVYKITNEKFFDYYGTDTFCLVYGSPYNWSTDTLKRYENAANAWKSFGDTIYTRYLKIFYMNKGYQKVRELILYGHKVGDMTSSSRIDKEDNHMANFTMRKFIGINVYGQTPPRVRYVAGTQRKYTDQSFIDNSSPAGTAVNDVRFNYTNTIENAGSIENYYFPKSKENGELMSQWHNGTGGTFADYDTLGIDLFWSLKSVPKYSLDSGWGKSIDYRLHPHATGSDPRDYDRLSRMAWVLGAVFGRNPYPYDSVQKLTRDRRTGTGTMHYIEDGNENNGSWLTGTNRYYTPQQAVAYNSAFYDGAEQKMGTRMGIKNADSTIKVILWGDASGDYFGYLKAMKYWSYYTRKDHKLPFDIYNIHVYFYDGKTSFSPENYKGGIRPYFRSVVDSIHLLCSSCEIWLSEWGYDRNRRSSLAVPIISGVDSAQIQADWIARSWLELSFSGLDRAQIFQIQNDPLPTQYDSLGYVKFNTTGLTDGHVNRSYLNYYAYPAYYYQHAIWTTLSAYKPDSIVYENYDSIWVYRYRNVQHSDSVAYAIWSGTQTNRRTTKYAIETGHLNMRERIIVLKNTFINGDTIDVISDVRGMIPLTITESPIFLFTTAGSPAGRLHHIFTPN